MRANLRVTLHSATWTLGLACLCAAPAARAQGGDAPAADAPAAGAAAVAAAPRDTVTWTTFKGDNQRTGASTANVPLPLNLLWRFTSDGPARPYRTTPLVLGPPGQQRVYVAVGKNILCLDSQTGQQIWRSANLNSLVVTPITLLSAEGGDYILIGQQNGRLTALRTADGGRAWEVDVRSSLASAGPIILDTAKGKRIICAIGAGRLIAYTLEGQLDPEWEVKLGRYGTSPGSSMALSSDGVLLYLTGSDGRLYAVDVQKAALVYSIPLASTTNVTPLVAGNQVVVATSRLVSGLRASAGDTVWSMNPRSEVVGSPAYGTVQDKPAIFLGTQAGVFYAVGTERGAIMWKTDVGATLSGSPLFLPNMVLVGTRNGQLVALNPNDGTVLWRYRLRSERSVTVEAPAARTGGGDDGGGNEAPAQDVDAGPAVRVYGVTSAASAVDGQVFVLGDNASIYSFTSKTFDANAPRILEPSLALPDENNKITSLLLDPNAPPVVPGRGPMYLAAELDDTGSGIDARTIQVLLDGAPIPAAAINFQPDTGVITATLLSPDNGTGFADGLKNITLIVKDYAGNVLQYTASFSVDNQAPPPAGQVAPEAPADGGGGAVDNGGGEGN